MDRVSVLAGSSLFDMLSDEELKAIATLADEVRAARGQVLFEEGQLGDALYVLSQGEVEVLGRDAVGALRSLATLGPQQFFGEMSLIDKEHRSATIRARTDCELLRLSSDHLTAFRRQHRDGFTFIVLNIARMLSARLREANQRLAGQPADERL